MELQLFRRENGTYGVRNRIAVISTVACANHVTNLIAASSEIADAYTHPYGCDQLGKDFVLSCDCLIKMGAHPNVGAVLVVGLGCESIQADAIAGEISKSGKPVEHLVIQEQGGTTKTVMQGRQVMVKYEEALSKQERVAASIQSLTIGLECGGSDYTSGLSANPAIGAAAEMLSDAGATLIISETAEFMGAEHVVEQLCANPETADFIKGRILGIEKVAKELGVDLRGTQPSPGNIDGGLSTIEEKSLGAVCKAGSTAIVGGLDFGESPQSSGLHFMDTPGNDLASMLGLTAGGAQIILFSTGRGTPMGFAVAPVIKITGNQRTAAVMAENTDVDLSAIMEGKMSIEEGGKLLLDWIAAVANGKDTAAEQLGHREFSLYRISPILT